jgi:hypothetical protein
MSRFFVIFFDLSVYTNIYKYENANKINECERIRRRLQKI